MTLPMSSYRADRIADLLDKGESLTVEDMQKMHYDLYSRQAEAFMEIIAPLLPASENGNILRDWDLRYDAASLGPPCSNGCIANCCCSFSAKTGWVSMWSNT